MNSARFNLSTNETGQSVVMINADYKSDAQEAIKAAKAFIFAAGGKCKLVFFHETTSEYSNLVRYYRARIVYRLPA